MNVNASQLYPLRQLGVIILLPYKTCTMQSLPDILGKGKGERSQGSGVDLMGLKPNYLDLSSFSALTLLVG